jgi:hypothetical protein
VGDVHAIAAAYGIRVEIADLGDWGRVRLIAEYDPQGPVIRVNRRESSLALRQAQRDDAVRDDVATAIDRAIAHELYHHREAIGEVPRLADRGAREAAADAYAETLSTAGDAVPLAAAEIS